MQAELQGVRFKTGADGYKYLAGEHHLAVPPKLPDGSTNPEWEEANFELGLLTQPQVEAIVEKN